LPVIAAQTARILLTSPRIMETPRRQTWGVRLSRPHQRFSFLPLPALLEDPRGNARSVIPGIPREQQVVRRPLRGLVPLLFSRLQEPNPGEAPVNSNRSQRSQRSHLGYSQPERERKVTRH